MRCLLRIRRELLYAVFASQGQVKLSKSGLYYMTGFGARVAFPIG